MRPRGFRAFLLAAVLLAAALVAGAVQRVPPDSVALRGLDVVPAGWHLHPPYRPLPVLPARGELRLEGVRLDTKEGGHLEFRVELSYAIGTVLAPAFARDVRDGGLRAAVTTMARRILDDLGRREDAETILSSPSHAEVPLRAGLELAGVGVSRLLVESPLGDELIRRRATEAARSRSRTPRAHVLFVGWDGADWDFIRPLFAQGRMPNLARLVAEGASGDLRSYDPMFSPLIWTTMATGKAPTEHGVADFVVRDVRTGARRPITSDFRKVKALWNVFSDFARPSTWLGWWASYPAETINGVVVSDMLAATLASGGVDRATGAAGIATPDGFLAEHKALLVPARAVLRSEVERFFPVPDGEWSDAISELGRPRIEKARERGEEEHQNPTTFLLRVLSATRTYQALAVDQVRSGAPFVAVYFEAVDMMGHRFQHFLPPQMKMVGDADFRRFSSAVTRWYEYQDALLGELLAAAPKDTITLLVSDHGFLTGDKRPEGLLPYTSVQPAEWHRDWGIVVLHGPGIRRTQLPPASVYDVAPTLLALEGLPNAEDMPGRVIDAAFEPSAGTAREPIRSYELAGPRLERTASRQVDQGAMDEMLANLRALGYVGGEPTAPQRSGAAEPAGDAEHAAVDTQVYFHRNLAVSFILQGRLQEAEAELLAANARKPLAKTYAMLSEVRARSGRYAQAAATVEEGWKAAETEMEPSSLLWIVELHLLAHDPEAARSAASRWDAKMTPAVRDAVRGRLEDAAGNREAAAVSYRAALESDPLLVGIAQRTQELDAAAGRPTAIEPFLVTTLASHPKVDAYWELAGRLAFARGEAAAAAERFHRAVQLQPENGLYLGEFASASAAIGHARDAREALAWADRFPPRGGDAWMAIGSAWDRLGEADRAVRAFDEAKRAGLPGPGADLGAALALARAGRRDEARRRLDAAEQGFPGHPAVRELRARLG